MIRGRDAPDSAGVPFRGSPVSFSLAVFLLLPWFYNTGRTRTMNLWTEYEGRTINGVYPLTKLIRPEGRSAFFSTSNGTGVPTVIRLIESHFDGDEILTRWRGVAALNHPNLVKLKSFGHVVVDETSLVYAVMEPVEANLSEILRERRLTVLETRQIATSLLAAIEALHSNGFVHEHVVPENVLAVGEVIKLRSDCIRETLEGEEGVALKRKDVRDYAAVLLQALTQQRTLEDASRHLPLPAPFEQIVRKGMSGEWGLAQIGTALKRPSVAQESAPAAAKNSAATDVGSHPAPSARVVAGNTPAPAGQNAAGDSRGRWRVVAFAYNREDQARQKVAEIAQTHPDLSPTVFTPNGHAPFLVTLGGPMSMQEAFALSGKAKREGLPKDTYAQNYRGSGN